MRSLDSPLRRSLEGAPVVRLGEAGYEYFIHPLTDGVPAIEPSLLRDVAAEVRATARMDGVTRIVVPEAMGIPVGAALSLDTGIPLSILRKRRYGLPGEITIPQATGYARGALHANGIARGDRVLVLDDVISTGGTLGPILEAFAREGIEVADVVVLIEKGAGKALLEKRLGVVIKTLVRLEVRDGRVHFL